jgi:antitoxin ParD1/3/4
MDVSLTSDLESLVNEKVVSGEYPSASEVIGEGLRLLEERDDRSAHRLEELRREIAIGLEEADRGELAPRDIENIKAEGRRLRKKSRQAR